MIIDLVSNISIDVFTGLLIAVITLVVALRVREDTKKMLLILIGGTVLAGLISVTIFLISRSDNRPLCPTISQVSANPEIITEGGTSEITVFASNPGGGALTFLWEAGIGKVPSGVMAQRNIEYSAPSFIGQDRIKVTVDNSQCTATATVDVRIVVK